VDDSSSVGATRNMEGVKIFVRSAITLVIVAIGILVTFYASTAAHSVAGLFADALVGMVGLWGAIFLVLHAWDPARCRRN